jgi:hypothetical protein
VVCFEEKEIRASVILPDKPYFELSLRKVMPVLDLASRKVAKSRLLPPGFFFKFLPCDYCRDNCTADHATHCALNATYHTGVHVFFGPTFEYCVCE